MKVYIVSWSSYDSYSFYGIFSSEEKAKEFIDKHGDEWGADVPDIDEIIVDEDMFEEKVHA
jgi:hypothetical protein